MKLSSITIEDLQRPETLSLIAGYLSSVVLAFVFGYLIAHESWRILTAAAVLTASILAAVRLQRRVWILIPFGWLLTGKLLVLPLPFAVRDLLILLALVSYVGYRAIAHHRVRVGWNLIDGLLAANLFYVAFGYFLHPVGFYALGSEIIGARPYMNIALAVVGYWLVVHLPDSLKGVSRIPLYWLAAATLISGMQTLAYLVPPVARYVYGFYSEVDVSAYVESLGGRLLTRLVGLAPFGLYLTLALCSYYPLGSVLNPRRLRFYALLLGLVCILWSGFRSYFLWIAAAMAIAGWLHRRWHELIWCAIVGVIMISGFAYGQGRFYELPPGIQRALCYLPGRWSEQVVMDAQGTSRWRFELWHQIIEQHLIKNWWVGDGFGARVEDIMRRAWLRQTGAEFEEQFLASGGYHSGPLTAIRYVGIIGLILLYILSIAGAIYSYKTVQRCRGTPLHPAAVFVAMQLIWDPIHYAFVFGGYDGYLPDVITLLGVLRLLMRCCDEGLVVPARESTVVPAVVSATTGALA